MHSQLSGLEAQRQHDASEAAERGNATPFNAGHHLINSKLKPPQPTSAWVERKKLTARLDKGSQKRLVVLTAPIGSGKTTLLNQWYQDCQEGTTAHPLAWLSLDEQDNEPKRFFSYLAGSVRSAAADFSAYIAPYIASGLDNPPLDPIVTAFAESLERIEQNFCIVLDDFQWIIDPALTRAFAFLVQRSPSNIHWIVSGRCMPDLELSRFRLQDELMIIDSADLNFSTNHIMQLGRKLCRQGLSLVDAECIRARTEGWVAGAKLALLSAADPANATESLAQFAGSHCEVARYLATTVLQEQSPAVREFLVTSSIVDRMNGDLCNALLGITNGQALLEQLERSQLFIQPLDSHNHWYRYHTLFLDFLRASQRRDAADRIPAQHLIASHWFAEHQMSAEALHHAFAAGDRGWCVELVSKCAHIWLRSGEIGEVLRWTAKLSHDELLGCHDIYTAYIACLILSRRFADASLALHEVEALSRQKDGSGDNRRVCAHVKTLRLMLSVLADSTGDADIEELELPSRNSADAFLASTLMTLQAYAQLRRQQFDVARRLAMRAREALRDVDSVYGMGYADVVACLADRAQGDMKAAADNCERMYATVRNGRRNPAWVNAATALAHVRYEQNRLAEAEELCVEVLPLLSVASTIETFTIAHLTLARVKAINKRHGEAFQLLDYLHSMLENGSHRRFLAQVCYEKIRLCLLTKNVARARAVATDFGLPQMAMQSAWQEPHAYDEAWDRLGFAHAALLMHEHGYDKCRAVLNVLRDGARKVGYVYREVSLEAALAACEWQAGQPALAFEALNRGFALTRGYGFTRSVLDEVPMLQDVIAAAVRNHKLLSLLPEKYFSRFQNIFAAHRDCVPRTPIKRKATLPLEPLTDREIDMLKLLSQGLSNLQISAHSQIALSTAKWHLKNVFAKLDVGTRTGAIARARELQLIE